MDVSELTELGQQLRVDAVRCAAEAGSGHPTSSMSAADLVAVLFARHLRYDFENPTHPGNDRLIFSKGHASPLLYAAYKAAGALTDDELLTYRTAGSRLEGHPTPRLPWVDVATGSLGQGLPIGAGMALAGKRLAEVTHRVWVLCGDSELAEGSMWEAFEFAGYEGLDNLVALIDVNRLGQRGPTRHGWDTGAYVRRISAFNWHTVAVDGHDPTEIDRALSEAESTVGQPTAIIARTRKGMGVRDVADKEGMHGKPLKNAPAAISELGGQRNLHIRVSAPDGQPEPKLFDHGAFELPTYKTGAEVATRTAFGEALAAVAHGRRDIIGLDAEVADSTRLERFAEAHPDRYFEFYIAEQQMIAAAVGLQARGWAPYIATFAAFLTRAYDFIRMAAISRANLRLIGSHAGTEIRADGPSQMGMEDLAALRAIYGSTVLYPCDANQTAKLVTEMADCAGISYLRTTRSSTPLLYPANTDFPIGGSRTLRSSPYDKVTVIAAGVTVFEALRAADNLAEVGIPARVIDAYSIKPIDAYTLRQAARETGGLLTVEDHWPEGGLGDAVLDIFADGHPGPRIVKLAARTMPGSASPEEQLRHAGIDAGTIIETARQLAVGT